MEEKNKQIAVIVPAYNEAESLPELTKWINSVMQSSSYTYELIFIDDGSSDDTWKVIQELSKENKNIRGKKFRRNYGKSAALNIGFEAANADVIITMDADMQDSPDEIPALYKMITEEGYDLVSGWKKKRHDPISKTIPSRFFNWVTRKMSGIKLHDFNCGLKAYKKELVKNIEVHGEMHRYIPVIAKWEGFGRIGEKVVQHQERKYGESKFGFERFINGFLDLLSISFITRFGKKPMHLFGTLGTLMFAIGLLMVAYIGIDKIYALANHIEAPLVADRPLFYIALTAMILGTQLFTAGFISELLSRNTTSGQQAYKLVDEIGE